MKEHIISGSIYDVKTVNIDYIKDSDNIRLDCNDVTEFSATAISKNSCHREKRPEKALDEKDNDED